MAPAPASPTPSYGQARVGYIVGLLFVTNVLSYVDRLALAVLLPSIKQEFVLTDLQLGTLTGIAFTICYALFGIPIARMADRGSRSRVLTASVAVWSAMTALTGMAQGFAHLALARVGVGIGEAGCVPPAHSIISDIVSPRRRQLAFALHTAGMPIGSLLGLALGGWLAVAVGWRTTFFIFGGVGMVVALVSLLTLPEPPRAHHEEEVAHARLLPAIGQLLSNRAYLLTLCGLGFAGFAVTGLLQWLPSYFSRTHGLSAREIGLQFGLAYGLGSMVGILAGGPLGGALAARDRRWPLWMATCAYIVAFPLLTGAIYAAHFGTAMVLVAIGFAVLTVPFGPVFAMVQTLVAPRQRALAVALTLLAGSLIGQGFGPLLIGYVSDLAKAAGHANPLRTGVMTGMAIFPFPAILYLLAARRLGRSDSRSA